MCELPEQLPLPLKFEFTQFHEHALLNSLCKVCYVTSNNGKCRHADYAVRVKASTGVLTFSGLGSVKCAYFTTSVNHDLRARCQIYQPRKPSTYPDFGGF